MAQAYGWARGTSQDRLSRGADLRDAASPAPHGEERIVLSPKVKARRNGLWLPAALNLDGWTEIGEQIAAINSSSVWWLGDWLIYGKKKFPDGYKRAIARTSLDYQTLRNYAWVCRQFPVTRRRCALSFQHHAELASLPPDEQAEWLDKAESLGWSLHELRRQLKAGNVRQRRQGDAEVTFKLAVSASQGERWQTAAAAAGLDTENWIVSVLDSVAEGRFGGVSGKADPE